MDSPPVHQNRIWKHAMDYLFSLMVMLQIVIVRTPATLLFELDKRDAHA